MAIDTKEKRAAVLGVARPWMRDKLPVETPDQEWRMVSGNAYGGNVLSPTVGGRVFCIVGSGGLVGPGGMTGRGTVG
jgi:hypothetical protein